MSDDARSDERQIIMIFNSIPPYAYEINNILGLPDSFTYRFRFRREYIHHDIRQPEELIGRKGLVVLRHFQSAEFIPLREIRVSDVLEVGNVWCIDYVLSGIVDFDVAKQAEQLEEFNTKMKSAIDPSPNPPGDDLRKLVFVYGEDLAFGLRPVDTGNLATTRMQALQSWGRLLDIVEIPFDICCKIITGSSLAAIALSIPFSSYLPNIYFRMREHDIPNSEVINAVFNPSSSSGMLLFISAVLKFRSPI